jgi:acetoin utilization deacetylase AcuC-like enzyme
LVLVLEGGYDLGAAAVCTMAVTGALLGHPWEDPLGPAPYQERVNWMGMVERAKALWNL